MKALLPLAEVLFYIISSDLSFRCPEWFGASKSQNRRKSAETANITFPHAFSTADTFHASKCKEKRLSMYHTNKDI